MKKATTARASFNSNRKIAKLNSQSKVICLVSGGIDSPVATWLMMRKGCFPVIVFFDNYPYADETTKQRAMEAIKKLGEYIPEDKLKVYVVPHGDDLTN
ncbi:MAG: hypothetical protein JSW29_05135, partial [Candidatus Bathyarchaeota archaeon]